MYNKCIIVINAYPEFTHHENSIESIRSAAKRWQSDFIEINSLTEKGQHISKKMFFTRHETLLKFSIYEKILMIDNDVVINNNSPNIFDQLEDYELAGVLDGNPTRFANNWVKESITKYIIDSFDYGCLNDSIEFDMNKYVENYLNGGVLVWNIQKIKNKLEQFLEIVENNQKILEALENNLSDQNLPNIFYSHFLEKVKILDDKWNWTMPDIAGKNGWYHDHFHPETGELIEWWHENDSPPDWTDHINKGKMHPYIYHFCGTDLSKELGKKYYRWFKINE